MYSSAASIFRRFSQPAPPAVQPRRADLSALTQDERRERRIEQARERQRRRRHRNLIEERPFEPSEVTGVYDAAVEEHRLHELDDEVVLPPLDDDDERYPFTDALSAAEVAGMLDAGAREVLIPLTARRFR